MFHLKNKRKKILFDKRLLELSNPFDGPIGSIVWGKLGRSHWWAGMYTCIQT
jgi:hypothetical protein